MTREELVNTLTFLDLDESPSVEMFIIDQPAIENEEVILNIYKGRMYQDLPQEIIDTFYPTIRKVLIRREYDLISYDPSVNPDRNVVWRYECKTVPFFNIVLQKLNDIDDLEYYDHRNLAYQDIWAVWIKLSISGSNFYILKKITPSKVLNTGGPLKIVYDDAVFRNLKSNVLTIDNTFDVFAINDILVFENKTKFENALLYHDVKRQVAESTLDELETVDIIENFDELREMLSGDRHSINKLNKLREKDYFKKKTFADYQKIIRDYGIQVACDETSCKFQVYSKREAKLLIKVLNDDYLKSELTNYKYATNSKEGIQ